MEKLDTKETKQPLEVGGWLILVAIGVILSPLKSIYFMGITYPSIFADGTWEKLTTEGSDVYSPIWGPFLIGEILINILFICLGVYIAYLFFTKKAALPKWYFAVAISSSIFILADAYVVTLVLPEMQIFGEETIKEFGRSLVSLLVWSPYLLFSQRAKDTFVIRRT
ncbi:MULTISPECIES: DUF2569 domain-containing protein [Rheinheimera]|uniref:DUF2569 domain-containing protein n=1 Tax=Rheinheimera TaxID=67575 RepID=UPI000E8D40AD|nr:MULTISPECIES: DUF2569 domain-containing protein [Rheinheimera]MCD1600335.1 DUF2569 domain-containing protein [Rheinheimera aquimaris]HBN90489.1 DUF2569 domain-containing protein [Rheinheimera sp.]